MSELMELKGYNGQAQGYGDTDKCPYVVLLGDVGTGKSFIVEKLTGEKGRSNDANLSVTRTSEPFWVTDRSMVITDTPGSNAIHDKLEHNVWIASALNFLPVSRILIIVKAEPRIDNVVGGVRKYAERLLDLEMDILGVLVTHMDTVTWTDKEFLPYITEELGIEEVVFSGLHTSSSKLLSDIHSVCKDRYDLTVDHENFLRFFKINNNQIKIIRCTNKAVEGFTNIKREFDMVRKAFTGNDLVDLIFEFNAWMGEEIVVAQKNMAEENKFTFLGDGAANEAGHIANMTNQLIAILYDIRVEAAGVQSAHGVHEARRCPHCNLVWTKIEGCDGGTTCGNRPSTKIDVRDPSFGVLGTYTFKWDRKSKGLRIVKSGTKDVHTAGVEGAKSFGCGKSIEWKSMPMVELPRDLKEAQKVSTDDVSLLPDSLAGASNWNRTVDNKLNNATSSMKLGPKSRKQALEPEVTDSNNKSSNYIIFGIVAIVLTAVAGAISSSIKN